MAIKYNGNAVDHIKKDGQWVKELKYDGNIVWEETYGVYKLGTLPTNMASLTCYRVSQDPAVSAGYITHNATLYNKDAITITAKGSGWYGVSSASYPNDNGYATASWTLATPDVASDDRETALDPLEELSFTVLDRRNAYLDFSSNINGSITCTYGDPYTHATKSIAKSDDYSFLAYNGTAITWTATPDPDRDVALEEVSGTITTGASAARIKPVARTYSWKEICPTWLGSGQKLKLTSFSSDKATGNGWSFGGLARYKKVRVSGTYTIKNAQLGIYSTTGSFSNVELSTDTSSAKELFSDQIYRTYNQITYFATATVSATKDDLLGITATRQCISSSILQVGYVEITITSIQAYLPFYGDDLDVSISDDWSCIDVNKCFDSRDLYVIGSVDYSSYYFSQTSFKDLGTNHSGQPIYTTELVDDASGDQSVESADCAFAIVDHETRYALSPMVVLRC